MHHALYAGDVIREVEREVASEVSIRGHEISVAESGVAVVIG